MSTRVFRWLRYYAWIWFLVPAFVVSGAAQEERPHVLILYAHYSNTAPYQAIASAFKTALAREMGEPVQYYEEPLSVDRYLDPEMEIAYAELIHKRCTKYGIDLIVPIGGPAAQFVAKYREQAFQETPALFLAVDERFVSYETLGRNGTFINQRINAANWIEDILKIAPDTTNIVYVAGHSLNERFWANTMRREFRIFSDRINFSWLEGLSLDEMERRVSALPPHTFILMGLMIEDAGGITYSGYEGLQRLHAVANAPIFGIFQSQMGNGIVGGRLHYDSTLGIKAGYAAARILRGEHATSIPGQIMPTTSPVYDWRELKRWGIDETRLPPGSSILFREPTAWQRYRWHIAGIVLFAVFEALLLVGLLANLLRRRRVERSQRQSEQKYRRLYESMMDAFVRVDMSGRIVEFNPVYRELLGYPEEELRLKTYVEITPERWHEFEAQVISGQVLSRGFSDVYEKEYRRKDGTVFPVELRTFLMKDESGKSNGLWAIVRDLTEKKKAEELLQQRNRYIETILEQAPIGFAIHAIDDGAARFVSARFEEIYGVPRGTMDSHYTFFDAVWRNDPEFREQIRRRVVADMVSGDASRMHWENVPVRTASGETRYISAMNIPLPDQNLMISTVQDVTEQVRAQKALQESEARLRLAAEAARFGSFSYGNSDRRFSCDSALLALFGLPPDAAIEMDPTHVPEAMHPEDKEGFRAQLMRASDPYGPGILDAEFRIFSANGQVRWLRTIGKVTFSADHRPFRTDGIVQDISERKRANEALRTSEERFRDVTEMVSDFVWEVDADGRYTYTSPSVEKILGYTSDELVGKMHFYDLFLPDIREQLRDAAFRVFSERQRFLSFPNANIGKTGSVVYLETSGMPILDAAGHLTGYRGADIDATAKRRAEMETQLLRQELALFSRIATVNELAASIAHEINQPLAAISNNAQVALHLNERGTLDPDELREILSDIVADNQRAAEVIRSSRSMLKKDAGEHQSLLLNDLIRDVLSMMRSDALTRGISVSFDLDSPLPAVRGDRVQLQQVILNLIVNAFEAMDASEGPKNLKIRARESDGAAVLEVMDSGPGLAADKLDSIFEPFVTTKEKGLGLGLALSRSIISAHNGRLWAESNPQGGASFFMALPAIQP